MDGKQSTVVQCYMFFIQHWKFKHILLTNHNHAITQLTRTLLRDLTTVLSTVRSPQQLTQQKWRTSCAVTRVRYKISCVTHVWSTIYFTYAHPNVKNNNRNKFFWRYVSNNGALSLGYKLHQTILKQQTTKQQWSKYNSWLCS